MSTFFSGKYALIGLILLGLCAAGSAFGVFWLINQHSTGAAAPASPASPHAQMGNMGPMGAMGQTGEAAGVHDAQIIGMVDRLAEKLKKDPNNGPAWAMLARSYGVLGRYGDAVNAYRKAAALQPKDASLLADLADALAMADNGQINQESSSLIRQALAIDPKHVKALALAGTEAYRRQDFRKALEYWRRGLSAAGNDGEWAGLLEASIRDAEGQIAGK